MYLDLRGCGIGNIVLMTAGYSVYHLNGDVSKVRLVCSSLQDVWGLRTDLFESVSFGAPPDDEEEKAFPNSLVCNVQTLMHPGVVCLMRKIVKPMPPDLFKDMKDVQAGFCIRTTDSRHDGESRFMNDKAIEAMHQEMQKYRSVMVFSNKGSNLLSLPMNATAYEFTDSSKRNTEAQWRQWYALSLCPIVYHGIGSAADTSVTSTFAPTAAVFGDRCRTLVGVDNTAGQFTGPSYHW